MTSLFDNTDSTILSELPFQVPLPPPVISIQSPLVSTSLSPLDQPSLTMHTHSGFRYPFALSSSFIVYLETSGSPSAQAKNSASQEENKVQVCSSSIRDRSKHGDGGQKGKIKVRMW